MKLLGKFATIGALCGGVLGLGAPLGAVLLAAFSKGLLSWDALSAEVISHLGYYLYMTCATPAAFAAMGLLLGILIDRLSVQIRDKDLLMGVLESRSVTDDITGLYNHRQIYEEIDKEIDRSRRMRTQFCGMMIDVDDFKSVNDRFGHLAGDRLLRELASVLRLNIRKIDILGRYGGDEFVIVLPGTPYEAAKEVAERVAEGVRRHPFRTQEGFLPLTVSIGLLSFDRPEGLTPADFIEKVDRTMFRAKELGKSQVCSGQSMKTETPEERPLREEKGPPNRVRGYF